MAEISIPQTVDPTSRLRSLGQLGSNVAIENEVAARRYLRSASEMERMVKLCFIELLYSYVSKHVLCLYLKTSIMYFRFFAKTRTSCRSRRRKFGDLRAQLSLNKIQTDDRTLPFGDR